MYKMKGGHWSAHIEMCFAVWVRTGKAQAEQHSMNKKIQRLNL